MIFRLCERSGTKQPPALSAWAVPRIVGLGRPRQVLVREGKDMTDFDLNAPPDGIDTGFMSSAYEPVKPIVNGLFEGENDLVRTRRCSTPASSAALE